MILRGPWAGDVVAVGAAPGSGASAHVAWVHDSVASTITPYVNGVAGTPFAIAALPTLTTTGNFLVGNLFAGGGAWQGNIDEFRFWNQARTGAQILAGMNQEAQGGISNDPGMCGAVVIFTNTATDNCGVVLETVTSAPTAGLMSGSLFPVGQTTVTYTATDAAMNSASCTFTVDVADTEDPTINCPLDINQSTDVGVCGATVNYSVPSTSDNCPGETLALTSGQASGTLFAPGTHTVTYTATDAVGNTSSCSFTITVTDNEAPTITCPADLSMVPTDAGICTASGLALGTATAMDNCLGAVSVTSSGIPAGGIFPLGATVITYTATDGVQSASCMQTVTVVDLEDPVVMCPADFSVNTDPGMCSAMVTFNTPATDNCTMGMATATATPASGSVFPLGATMVTVTVVDAAGNTGAGCSFMVTVVDNQGPVFTGCSNITTSADPGLCSAMVNFAAPVATDACVGVVPVTQSGLPSGSPFPVGMSTVVYTATDGVNSQSCSFTVTVTDNENPVLSVCPADIDIELASGVCETIVSWTAPTGTDNCPVAGSPVVVTQIAGPASGSTFFGGVDTVTYMATDAAGNTATCSFTVTVRGDFGDVQIYPTGAGTLPQELVLADLDGVNGKDIVTVNIGDDSLSIRLNDGTGHYGALQKVLLPPGCGAVAVAAGEFYAGGGVDLAVACVLTDTVLVLENTGGAVFTTLTSHALGGLQEPFALAAGDTDGSTLDDIAVACQGDLTTGGAGVAIILDNLSTTLPGTPMGFVYRRPQDIAMGDLDTDGDMDLAVVEISTTLLSSMTQNVLLFEGDGAGSFGLNATLDTNVLDPHSVCIADLDANGLANDISVACDPSVGGNGVVLVYINTNGLGFVPFGAPTAHSVGLAPRDIACGDLQKDSLIPSLLCRDDVVVANFGSTGPVDMSLLIGYDCPTMNFINSSGTCDIGDGTVALAMCDLNGDGYDDIVAANQPGNFVAVFLSRIRAISTPFGTGCNGSYGVPQISGPALAIHGQTATVMLSNAGNGAAAASFVLGVSVDYAVQPIGGGPCISYLAPPVLVVNTGTTVGGPPGTSTFSFLIPPASMMIPSGLELYFQYAVFDQNGAFNSMLAFTPALRVRLGN
jgi:hypothetical protein